MKIIELVIDELQEDGVEAISVVESPAIEENFVALKSNSVEIKFEKQDAEKKILMGPILIPNKPIFRVSGEDEYYIYFSRETVKKASELYLQAGNQSQSTLEHEMQIQGLTLVESWIVEDKENDKSNVYDMDVPVGTWMGAVKVNNDEIWNDYVKTGKVKGFSIEGYFADKAERPKENIAESLSRIEQEEAEAIVKKLKEYFKESEGTNLESYNDYPQSVKNNAKRGRELNEKVNNKCATQVGKVRGATLEKGGNLEADTIMRMYSYLSRAEEDYDENDTKACGTISYLLWGGLAGKRWAESKLKELGKL
jgi:archaellin